MALRKFLWNGFALVVLQQAKSNFKLPLVQYLLEFPGIVGYHLANFIKRFLLRHPYSASHKRFAKRLDMQVISSHPRPLATRRDGGTHISFIRNFILRASGIFNDPEHAILHVYPFKAIIKGTQFLNRSEEHTSELQSPMY